MESKEINVLSLSDIRFLKNFIEEQKKGRQNTPLRSSPVGTHQSPETYVAVPKMDIQALKTTTDAYGNPILTPGTAECDVYRVNQTDGTLIQIGLNIQVKNSAGSTLSTNIPILVTRDKLGQWWAVSGGGSGHCTMIRFYVSAPIPGTMSVVGNIEAVLYPFFLHDVQFTSDILIPGYSGTDTVIICDPLCSVFNEPGVGLLNRRGFAVLMQPIDTNICQTTIGFSPVGYGFTPQWEVIQLNCLLNPPCH